MRTTIIGRTIVGPNEREHLPIYIITSYGSVMTEGFCYALLALTKKTHV
jgi:hypothetical protein